MNSLIIEDDENKARNIKAFMVDKYPGLELTIKKSYQSGLKAIHTEDFNVVLLDMQLPNFDIVEGEDGYRFRQLAGEDILKELRRKKKKTGIIIVTQFEKFGEGKEVIDISDLKDRLRLNYPENYIGTVFYSAKSEIWKEKIAKLISKNIL
ncbi:MAG: hypothetical protein A3K10_14130 [Bacteroidetes bacterium RIFCSPLOWO2_12_FULL_31_6]|nr:MAG: hypothetical protein A3K10_14130 [Bacteroidetes bacterium RIFCSPLOWO2_12_FULL_31_6]